MIENLLKEIENLLESRWRQIIREELQNHHAPEPEQDQHIDLDFIWNEMLNRSVSKDTIRNWDRRGYIVRIKIGRRVIYSRSQVQEFLQSFKKYQRQN